MNFLFSQYGLALLPIIVSIIGVLYSNYFARNTAKRSVVLADEANKKAQEANDLAKEALRNSERQFVEANRPQLTARPVMQNNMYYEISRIDDSKIYVSLFVVVENKGNVVASSTSIEEATCQVSYAGSRITYSRNYYDGLGNAHGSKNDVPKSNFTLIDVQPHDGYLRKLEFLIDLSSTMYSAKDIIQQQLNLAVTINLRLVCTYELIGGKQFVTHTSHGITKEGMSVLENRMGVYDAEKP